MNITFNFYRYLEMLKLTSLVFCVRALPCRNTVQWYKIMAQKLKLFSTCGLRLDILWNSFGRYLSLITPTAENPSSQIRCCKGNENCYSFSTQNWIFVLDPYPRLPQIWKRESSFEVNSSVFCSWKESFHHFRHRLRYFKNHLVSFEMCSVKSDIIFGETTKSFIIIIIIISPIVSTAGHNLS